MGTVSKEIAKSSDYGIQNYYSDSDINGMLIGFFDESSSIYPNFPGIKISVSVDRYLPLMSINLFGMPLLYQLLDALHKEFYYKTICDDPHHTLEFYVAANQKWWITITTVVDMNDDPSYMDKAFYEQDQDLVRWDSGRISRENLKRVSISLRLSQTKIDQLLKLITAKIDNMNSSGS